MNKISAYWPNLNLHTTGISIPDVAWEIVCKEVIQLTARDGDTPATYRLYFEPVDLNDKGAVERDVVVGYSIETYLGDIGLIIAVNEDGSIDVSDNCLSDYGPISGRPAMIYNEKSSIPAPVINTDWWEEDLSCVHDGEGHNTGVQVGIRKQVIKDKITGVWSYTGVQEPITRTNMIDCAPPPADPYFMALCVAFPDYWQPTEVVYAYNKSILNTPPHSGYNYLFISSPTVFGKPNVEEDGSDITDKFDFYSADNRAGKQPNTIWKSKTTSLTTTSTSIKLTYE